MKKYLFLFLLLLEVNLKIYLVYHPALAMQDPFLKGPFLDILLLLGMIYFAGKKINGYVVFALVSNFLGGFSLGKGSTMEEKMVFFFIGMAFYFSLHLNLILYFAKINPDWKEQIKNRWQRLVLPLAWWLGAYALLVPIIPTVGIVPVFIYSGIYVVLIVMAWNLDGLALNKINYLLLIAGILFFMLSDTVLGFALFGQLSGKSYGILNIPLAEVTWTLGVFLVFYALTFIQAERGEKTA